MKSKMLPWWVYLQPVLNSVPTKTMLRLRSPVKCCVVCGGMASPDRQQFSLLCLAQRHSSERVIREEPQQQSLREGLRQPKRSAVCSVNHPVEKHRLKTSHKTAFMFDSHCWLRIFFGNVKMNWSEGGNVFSLRGHSGYVCHYTYTSDVRLTAAAADTSNIRPT